MNTNYKEIDEQFTAKYGVTFEALSKRLEENGSTIEEEDDWLEWEAAVNMLNAK